MIIILAFLSVFLFVVGISLLFKSYSDLPAGGQATPQEDDRLKQELANTREESQQLKQQLDILAVELDESRQKLQATEQKGQEYDALKAKESEYQDKIRQLQHDLNYLYSKADQQAASAVGVLEELGQQKGRLQGELAALEQKIDEAPVAALTEEKERLLKDLESYQAKINSLETERDQLQETVRQAQAQAQTAVQQESEHQQAIATGIKKIHDRVKSIESEFADLLRSKEEQCRQAQAEVERLNEAVQALQDEQAQNRQQIDQLQSRPATPAAPQDQARAEYQTMESAKGAVPNRDEEWQRLKQQNAILAEKESLLLFELTKSRAKVMGLEKLCRDMRRQQQDQVKGRS